mgnify:CR=1 FL=1|tara:strand:- start:2967 stop:3161 length:195 start_codon:yes stop_codon:yes gene_type:complete
MRVIYKVTIDKDQSTIERLVFLNKNQILEELTKAAEHAILSDYYVKYFSTKQEANQYVACDMYT